MEFQEVYGDDNARYFKMKVMISWVCEYDSILFDTFPCSTVLDYCDTLTEWQKAKSGTVMMHVEKLLFAPTMCKSETENLIAEEDFYFLMHNISVTMAVFFYSIDLLLR